MDIDGGIPEQETMKVFGVDFSNEDLTDVFTTCIFCLNHAIDRTTQSTETLQLSVIRLRLTRWGEAVQVYQKPALNCYDPDPDELQEIRQALFALVALFDTGNPVEKAIVAHRGDEDQDTRLLKATLGAIALERCIGGSSLLGSPYLGSAQWSEVQFECASNSIRQLEDLFGAQHLRDLCARERLRINNQGALNRLEAISKGLDPWMTDNDLKKTNFGGMFIQMGSGYQYNNNFGIGTQYIDMGGMKFNKD